MNTSLGQFLHALHIPSMLVFVVLAIYFLYANIFKDWLFYWRNKVYDDYAALKVIAADESLSTVLRGLAKDGVEEMTYKFVTGITIKAKPLRTFTLKLLTLGFTSKKIRIILNTVRIKKGRILIQPYYYLVFPGVATLYLYLFFRNYKFPHHQVSIVMSIVAGLYIWWFLLLVFRYIQATILKYQIHKNYSEILDVE